MLYRLIILALSSSVLAAYQEPLGTPKAFSWDPTFDDQVAWCLEHFNVPGLAVSFVHGEEWSAKVPFRFYICVSYISSYIEEL